VASIKQISKVLIVLMAIIFLCVGLLSGFGLAAHQQRCCECAKNRSACTELARLQQFFRQLAGFLGLSTGVIVATAYFITTAKSFLVWSAPSLVVYKVRMNN
jgi:hypothetical protein